MQRIEMLISRLLLIGVAASMVTVFLGLALTFVHHPEYLKSAADLKRLTSPVAAFPHTIGEIARGVVAGRGQAVVAFGLILLLATPILRVVISLVGFALERDLTYSILCAAVLLVLFASFLLGKAG